MRDVRLRLLAATVVTSVAIAVYVRTEGPTFLLGWIAFVPWFAALDGITSLRRALLGGLLMSVGFTLAVFYWFAPAMQDYTGAALPITWLVLLAIAPLLEPQFVFFALARTAARRAGAAGWIVALAGAGIYVGSEWLLPKLFADTFGHPQFASPRLRQAADLAGAPGLTFVLVLANESVLSILRHRSRRAAPAAIFLAAVILVMLVYGEARLRQFSAPGPAEDELVAGIVQADMSHYSQMAADIGTFAAVRMILDGHFALSAQALERGPLDLLVWPETVYPTTFGRPKSEDGAAYDREITDFVQRSGVPLLFGAYDAERDAEFNAAVLLQPSPGGNLRADRYRKMLLFPLTERVPAWFDSAMLRRWWPWLGTWKPGATAQVFDLQRTGRAAVRLAPLICYDAIVSPPALAAVRQGAEVIVTLSNDSWFAEGAGIPHLILIVSAFRSLETRRPQVRATNTGVSAVISATGEFSPVIGVHEKGILVRGVHPGGGTDTLMLAWGDWFGGVALALGSAFLGLALVRGRRSLRRDRLGAPSRHARKRMASRRGTPT